MATIASAKKKYQDKVAVMPANYVSGMAGFLGVSASSIQSATPVSNYRQKIGPGAADKWERNLKAAWGIS